MRPHPRHTLLALCAAAYFAIRFAQVILGPVLPSIIETFDASAGLVGAALTGMWLAYALVQLPSGLLADRFGERSVVLVAVAFAGGAAGLVAAAPTYPAFAGFLILLGVGGGLYYNAATALLSRSYRRVGGAIGAHRIGGQGAGLVAPLVATAVATRLGWRAAILLGAAVAIVVLAAFARGVPPTAPVRPDRPLRADVDPGVLWSMLRRPGIAYATAVASIGEFVSLATFSFLPTLLVSYHGLGLGTAGLLFSGYFAAVVLAQPIVGRLSDRAGHDAALGVTMAVGVGGYAALAWPGTLVTIVPAVVLAGIAMSWSPPVQARVMAELGEEDRGLGFGLVRTGYILFGALGTTVAGTVADAAGWGTATGVLAGLLVCGALLVGGNRLFGVA